jgi:hypothetical protein
MEMTPDAFASLDALLKVLAEPSAFKARMAELKAKLAEVAAAETKLTEERRDFEETRRKAIGELEAERERIRRQMAIVMNPQEHSALRAKAKLAEKGEAA